MEELWNQLESMQAARQKILVQLGELYVHLEDIETQRRDIKDSISHLRSQLLMISQTYEALKGSLAKNLGLKDGVYDIDFANRRIVPNGQVSDSGNSESGPDSRSVGSGSDGGDSDDCRTASQ